jgi:hypothetical protein
MRVVKPRNPHPICVRSRQETALSWIQSVDDQDFETGTPTQTVRPNPIFRTRLLEGSWSPLQHATRHPRLRLQMPCRPGYPRPHAGSREAAVQSLAAATRCGGGAHTDVPVSPILTLAGGIKVLWIQHQVILDMYRSAFCFHRPPDLRRRNRPRHVVRTRHQTALPP